MGDLGRDAFDDRAGGAQDARDRSLGGTPLWEAVRPDAVPSGAIRDEMYLDIYPPSFQHALGGHVPRRQPVRPVPYAPPGDQLLPAVAAGDRPLVYATFGTELPDHAALRTVVEAIAPLEIRILATVRPRGDPEAFGPQPENVTIARYVPQTAVLPHASVVISHGGSGTVLAAISAGLPQLCLPQFADQPLNATAVADTGAGLALQVSPLDPRTIRESVTKLLTETAFRARALALQDEIMHMPSPDTIASLLPKLVNG
jgi:MGT family glycosyltransferase